MKEQIQRFLTALDEELANHARGGEHLDLYHIGRSVLVLQYELNISTRDFDIVQLRNSKLQEKAIELFGKDTSNAKALGLYLDPVPQGLPRNKSARVQGGHNSLARWPSCGKMAS
jgi:hypothetical protein